MSTNFTGNASIPKILTIGWFRFPIDIDMNYEVIVILHHILVVSSFLTNPILLCIIVKTLSNATGKNSGLLLAIICLTNIFVTGFGFIKIINGSVISDDIMSRVMSIFLPMYYLTTFLLALNNYGLIVIPLKFKTLSPKPKTLVGILGLVWITVTLVFVVAPSLVNFDDSVIVTAVVAFCWSVTIIIAIMYAKILLTLYRRKVTLRRTLNVSGSRQGLVVIKQNTRLAKVLLFYILVLIVLTLPLYTSVMLERRCSPCDKRALVMFIGYSLPAAMSMPVIHVFHWLLLTPLYYKEVKRLIKKVFFYWKKH